jgi:hypothetical protein
VSANPKLNIFPLIHCRSARESCGDCCSLFTAGRIMLPRNSAAIPTSPNASTASTAERSDGSALPVMRIGERTKKRSAGAVRKAK